MKYLVYLFLIPIVISCSTTTENAEYKVRVFETSQSGNSMTELEVQDSDQEAIPVTINLEKEYQTVTGFGGAFTEASAYLLNQMSDEKRQELINAYFSKEGANYSLTRTHINSCDFSLSNYSYTPTASKDLNDFSIKEDMDDIVPMIKDAMAASEDGFKLFSSPWTAPPWMKDNNSYVGGKLLPEYYDAWAMFFSKYIDAYKEQGIDIWGLTVENEPLGNGNNWESMHYSPEEMNDFVVNYLKPSLVENGKDDILILGYDQNRDHLDEWVDIMYSDEKARDVFDGTAIHWYASTYHYFPEELQNAHETAPDKYLIMTEACVDSEIPHWQEDDWYWSKEGTDWGWDWAPEEDKYLHPKYVPVHRYATNIIGSLNNHVDGWVDWNMVLDRQGDPNWFENWCVAPIIVDPNADEIYYTPIYYTMSHFSKYIRPGAKVVDLDGPFKDEELMGTAAQNKDGSIAIVLFNPEKEAKTINLSLGDFSKKIIINPQAIQTITFNQ